MGVVGVEFCDEHWDEEDLCVRNDDAELNERPSSSTGVWWPDDDDVDKSSSSLTLSLVRICSSIWIFNMVYLALYFSLGGNFTHFSVHSPEA